MCHPSGWHVRRHCYARRNGTLSAFLHRPLSRPQPHAWLGTAGRAARQDALNYMKGGFRMAIYHYSEKPVKRSAGSSAVRSAGYIEKERIRDERTRQTVRYDAHRDEVIFSRTRVPEGCPYDTTSALWNAVEAHETSQNAVVGQRVDIALPHELSRVQQIALADAWADTVLASGRGVTYAIHDPKRDGHNIHIDAIMTPRPWDATRGTWGAKSRMETVMKNGKPVLNDKRGKGKHKYKRKCINLDDKDHLQARRKAWEKLANDALCNAHIPERIDHRSLQEQRANALKKHDFQRAELLDRVPQIHVGWNSQAHERKEINNEIKRRNNKFVSCVKREDDLQSRQRRLQGKISVTQSEIRAWRRDQKIKNEHKHMFESAPDARKIRATRAATARRYGCPSQDARAVGRFARAGQAGGQPVQILVGTRKELQTAFPQISTAQWRRMITRQLQRENPHMSANDATVACDDLARRRVMYIVDKGGKKAALAAGEVSFVAVRACAESLRAVGKLVGMIPVVGKPLQAACSLPAQAVGRADRVRGQLQQLHQRYEERKKREDEKKKQAVKRAVKTMKGQSGGRGQQPQQQGHPPQQDRTDPRAVGARIRTDGDDQGLRNWDLMDELTKDQEKQREIWKDI